MFDHPSCQATNLTTGSIRLILPPIPHPPSTDFSFAPIIARRVQRRAVEAYWDLLSNLLSQHGTSVSLDSIDHDPDEGCWLIHFGTTDPRMVTSLHEVAMNETLSHSDLIGFEADSRIKDWLKRIERDLNALLSGWETAVTTA